MSMVGLTLLADSGPQTSIAPGGVLQIGGVTITNSILYGWISITIMLIVLIAIGRRMSVRPKGGIFQFVEVGVEFIMGTVESAFEDKSVARRYMPFFATLFFFLLVNNWLGLIPGVGEAIHIGETPLLRPFTADLNGTLAAASVTMMVVWGASIREFGSVRKFLRHFFAGSPLNPLYFVIGLLEMFSNLMRIISLSLRLFLNIAIGEIVIAVFAYLGHIIAPATATPFYLIDAFEGALQAFIFTTLSIMYLAAAVNHAAAHESVPHERLTEPATPETMEERPAQPATV